MALGALVTQIVADVGEEGAARLQLLHRLLERSTVECVGCGL